MLALTRKPGESIMIGDDVKITILERQGNEIKLGISAPKHVAVHREEIYNKIKTELSKGKKGNWKYGN